MMSPKLIDMPTLSPKKTGWPWDVKPTFMPATMPDGQPWPKISIVTPNYNYGQYLEETIRSVLLQGYPNLEYIIMDGGSADKSLDIIKKYEPWIIYWESEKDCGQSDAINKGFSKATGDIIAWLNSDDVLLPDALHRIAEAYDPSDEKLMFANVINFHPDGREEEVVQSGITLENFIGIPLPGFRWHQPGMFVPRSFYLQAGQLDLSLHYIFDWDWICRLLIHRSEIRYVDVPVARFRVHGESKTGSGMMECWQEAPLVIKRYTQHVPGLSAQKVLAFYQLRMASLYLAEHAGSGFYWNRSKGLRCLLGAAARNPGLLLQVRFIRLMIRALLPTCIYRSK